MVTQIPTSYDCGPSSVLRPSHLPHDRNTFHSGRRAGWTEKGCAKCHFAHPFSVVYGQDYATEAQRGPHHDNGIYVIWTNQGILHDGALDRAISRMDTDGEE